MADLSVGIVIGQLFPDDDTATILNGSPLIENTNKLGVGKYLDFLHCELKNSLIDQSTESKITIKPNSLFNIIVTQLRNGTNAQSGVQNQNIVDNVNDFLNNLIGRPITVYINNNQPNAKNSYETKTVYQGYISHTPNNINAANGINIDLTCLTLLGQLMVMTSNGSWQDATQTYGSVFTAINNNTVNTEQLINGVFNNSLLENTEITEISGNSNPLPNTVWAAVLPDMNRLDVLKEILVPYNKLIYQDIDGTIYIQPLFVDDYADESYNVDVYNNSTANWIDIEGNNKAASLPNRLDVLFQIPLPTSAFGLNLSSSIFASAPFVNSAGIIAPNNNGTLNYTDVYSTSCNLYNSQKFIMPKQVSLALDSSLITNAFLYTTLMSPATVVNLSNSVVYASADKSLNSIVQLYAQMYIASLNVENYNATIIYDYLKVVDANSPLGQIVKIDNFDTIDYAEMLAVNTTLRLSANAGSTLEVDFCPLLSILGCWFSVNEGQ
jgi:hypothetical protein